MNKFYSHFFSFLLILSTNQIYLQTFDFSCMEDDEISLWSNLGSDLEKDILDVFGEEVTLSEEIQLGNQVLAEYKKELKVYSDGERVSKLKAILSKLKSKIEYPRGFTYSIYLLESKDINAFTCGGKIFITTGMYYFCKNDSEFSAIIGHEIAHNELKHINQQLSKYKTANSFGSVGNMSILVGNLFTTSFNQKNEVHCDFYGINLMQKCGYLVCSAVNIWQRMAENEGENTQVDSFFSTHPYSSKRMTCCKNHIESNFSIVCP
jgi:predicted Zn-dependent protease